MKGYAFQLTNLHGRLASAVLFVTAVGCTGARAVTFTDVTSAAMIDHVQAQTTQTLDGRMSGGAAAADYDNDGLVDLFVTRLDDTDILYRNLGDGTFEDVSVAAGFTANKPTNGAAFADIDNDGDQDLYLTSLGGSRFYLYINDGQGGFDEQAVARGASVPQAAGATGQGVAFGDYDGDGYLDIATSVWGQGPAAGSGSRLLRNLGDANPGHYEDLTVAAGVHVHPNAVSLRFSPRFVDMDGDGRQDLTFAADFLTSQLFWNNGDGTFTDGTQAAGVGTDRNGMGSTVADYDGDGDLDWFVTAIWAGGQGDFDGGNRLYENNGDRTFTDVTVEKGVLDAGWGWGTSFLDHDNDGDLDLIATNGWDEFVLNDRTTLWENNNGTYTDISGASGITDTDLGRGLLTLDYDNDGDLDVFIVNNAGVPILYENNGGDSNNWLRVYTRGVESNRDGIGARITVDPDSSVTGDEMVQIIDGGSNYLAQNEKVAHFGLAGLATNVDEVRIEWPGGVLQRFYEVPVNAVLNAVESALPGDLDGDGYVGIGDLNIVLGNWNASVGPGRYVDGDASGDGFVGIGDLNIVLGNWNTGAPPGADAVIPEPGVLGVMGAFGVVLALSRKRL